jgi:hypothetical protein
MSEFLQTLWLSVAMHDSLSRKIAAALPVAIMAVLYTPAFAAGEASLFDKPVKVVQVPLPRDPGNPQARPEISCSYYPHFAIKEIDLGEPGAGRLSILSTGRSTCRRDVARSEKVVSADDWTGYFKGVKGGYIFFDADDGWNDGMGFAVFTADARKEFEDTAKKWKSVEATPSSLTLHYERVWEAPCSLQAGGSACWQHIRHDTGLTDASPPDCRSAYQREQKRTPKFARQVLSDPTVIDYDVIATIDAMEHKIVPASGKALRCRPAE